MLGQDLSAEHQRLVDNAKEMKREAELHREKKLKAAFDRRNKFLMGEQWTQEITAEMEDWQATPVVNHCRKAHHWYLSLLTDAPAKIAVFGKSEDDYQRPTIGMDQQSGQPIEGLSRVDRIERLMYHKWDQIGMENANATAYSIALEKGIAWFKVCIDRDLTWVTPNTGELIRGDLNVFAIDPWYVMVDPAACWSANPIDAVRNAEYIIHTHVVSVRRLMRQYPELKEQIAAAAGIKKDDLPPYYSRQVDPLKALVDVEEEYLPQANAAGSSTNTGGNWIKPTGEWRPDHHYDGKRCLVWECWMRDPDYPNGVVLTMVDDFMLQMRPNPYEHGEFPFVPYVVNPIPGRLYGYGILDIIIPVQQVLNKCWGNVLDHRAMYKDWPISYEKGSIDEADLVFGAGAILPRNPGSAKPEPIGTPGVPQDDYRIIEMATNVMRELIGIDESIMASAPKAGTPGIAIESMIEQAMQRIRMIDRWNIASRKKLAKFMLSTMQQLYRYTGYEARILGQEGDPQSIFLQQDDFRAEYDVDVKTNTARSLKNESLFKKAGELNSMYQGAFPWDEHVDLAGFDNREEIKRKMRRQLDLQAQLQEAQQMIDQLQQELGQAGVSTQGPPPAMGG